MLRSSLLYLSRQQALFDFVKHNGIARSFASRFVAGETVNTALDAVTQINAKGISASLDLLGESVHNAAEARETGRQYVELLDRIHERRLNANVSVKLTALGQDIDDALCLEVITTILERAKRYDTFVRLDMESSAYTDRTLDFFEEKLWPNYPRNVGVVLQSALRRTLDDVERAIRIGCRVRICKGAYLEPPGVAYPEKSDVDRNYVEAMHRLMQRGHYPGIATHDEAIITEAKRFARENDIPVDRYEFQMLYGVRRDLQEQLVRDGYRVRVYVPYGGQWYPYLMRRLAERPANIAFMAGNVMKEMLGGGNSSGARH
jgi:proline dehydrogenase